MSQTTARRPAAYQPSVWGRIGEGLRYGGGIGQWSWLAHRLSGLGILVFLIWHVIDTFFVVAFPHLYDHTVAIYGGIWFDGGYYWPLRWGFRIGELGLIAAVLFHSINGVGVCLYDLWARGTLYRRTIQKVIQIVFWTLMALATVAVLYPLRKPPDDQVMKDVKTDIRPDLNVRPAPGR